jgi:hypothetical protein
MLQLDNASPATSTATPPARLDADEKLAIGQFMALAEAANVHFELLNDRLVMRMSNPRWKLWAPIRTFLDDVGISRMERYFRETTTAERVQLSDVAAISH